MRSMVFFLYRMINSKNISRTFSGVVVDSVGSVHFQIVPWSGLYFSRSISPSLITSDMQMTPPLWQKVKRN